MKKVICLVVALLLLAGCSKSDTDIGTASPVDTPELKGYMSEPQILISPGHKYKEESWLGDEVEFKDSTLAMTGDSFYITIIFQGSFEDDKLKEAVSVEGFKGTPEMNIIKSEGKTVLYTGYREIENNKKYKLIISKSLKDIEGKTLKADIEKEITLNSDTIALFSFWGAEAAYGKLGSYTIMDTSAVGSMNLSPAPKNIAIDFSEEVDKQSVEQSIAEGLQGKGVKYSFKWNNGRRVLLALDGFKSGEDEDYAISMDKAKDAEGKPIYGSLYFVVGKANLLGSIDIKSKSNTVIKKFIDKRYMVVQSPSIDRGIIIDDTEVKSVYNLQSESISKIQTKREYTIGIPSLSFLYSWRDSESFILLDSITGDILSYSMLDGISTQLFNLPIDIVKGNIMDIAVSPNGRMLAVVHEISVPGESYEETNAKFCISIYDMKGKLLYKVENQFRARYMEIFGAIADVQWLDNENVVLEDNLSTESLLDYNIVKINIKTGKKSLIAEHAYKPVTMPEKGLMKIERAKDFGSGEGSIDIIKDDKVLRSFERKLYECSNFFFADENTMVYNHNDEVVVYYIDTGKSEVLGDGYIIGVSKDGSKLYYMTNYKMFYYIP
ncbi:MAG: hypothetical protein WBL93_03180 [Lutisporaceae bacterium]